MSYPRYLQDIIEHARTSPRHALRTEIGPGHSGDYLCELGDTKAVCRTRGKPGLPVAISHPSLPHKHVEPWRLTALTSNPLSAKPISSADMEAYSRPLPSSRVMRETLRRCQDGGLAHR